MRTLRPSSLCGTRRVAATLLCALTLSGACASDSTRRAHTRDLRPAAGVREHPGGVDEGELGAMRGLTHSRMHDRLVARGVVPERLRQATPAQRDEIMDTFCVSLGVGCEFCHNPNNYDEVTPRIVVAASMWQKYARSGMRLRDGSALYCDSCHHGSATFLHRDEGAQPALMAVMHEYESQLVTREGQGLTCEGCHGEPFRARFLPRVPLDAGAPPASTAAAQDNGPDGGVTADSAVVGEADAHEGG